MGAYNIPLRMLGRWKRFRYRYLQVDCKKTNQFDNISPNFPHAGYSLLTTRKPRSIIYQKQEITRYTATTSSSSLRNCDYFSLGQKYQHRIFTSHKLGREFRMNGCKSNITNNGLFGRTGHAQLLISNQDKTAVERDHRFQKRVVPSNCIIENSRIYHVYEDGCTH